MSGPGTIGFRFPDLATPTGDVDLRTLDEYARHHHGLVSRRAAQERGISRAAWYRALAAGSLEPVHPGVARLVGSAETREQRIAAAVMGAGPGAVASHRSAAHLWGIPRPDDDGIDVMLLDRRREATLTGVVVHRPRDGHDVTPVRRHGIATTDVPRLLCDLGRIDAASVPAAVAHVVTTGLASPVTLRAAVEARSRQGRHGVPALRDALDGWILDGRPTDGVLASGLRRLVAEHGLPPVELRATVNGVAVDARFVDSPVVLDCEGWDPPGPDPARIERDRARDTALAVAGHVTIRFTYRQVLAEGPALAGRIREVLRQLRAL